MIHPLVKNTKRPRQLCHRSHRILCQDHHIKRCDDLIDAVVDFRIQMIRSSRQNDGFFTMSSGISQRFLTLLMNIRLESGIFSTSHLDGFPNFITGDTICLKLHLVKLPLQLRVIIVRQERMTERHLIFMENIIHISCDHFRIRCHDRAVVVIRRITVFLAFIVDARVEDPVHILLSSQPFDMPVHQLCRIARRIGRNGLHAALIKFLAGFRRKNHPESQLREERMPERIIFIHVQHPRDTHRSASCFITAQRFISKQSFQFIFIQVRQLMIRRLYFSFATLAAISGKEPRSIVELVDGHQTVVFTSAAPHMTGFYRKCIQCFQFQQRGHISFSSLFACDQRCAICSHKSCDVRTDDLLAQDILNGTQYRVVEERSALHDDLLSGLFRISQLDHLIKGILNDGIRQPGRNIADRSALFLRLLYL